MAEDILPEIFLPAVQTFLPAGRTEDRYSGSFSEGGLENAERCVRSSVDEGT